MKLILLTLITLMISTSLKAQDSTTYSPFKKGTWGINFHGELSSNFDFYFNSNKSLSGIYFYEDLKAYQATVYWNGGFVPSYTQDFDQINFYDFDESTETFQDTSFSTTENNQINVSTNLGLNFDWIQYKKQTEKFYLFYSKGFGLGINQTHASNEKTITNKPNINSGTLREEDFTNSAFGVGVTYFTKIGFDYRAFERVNLFAMYSANIGYSFAYTENTSSITYSNNITSPLNLPNQKSTSTSSTFKHTLNYSLVNFSFGARVLLSDLNW